MSNNPTPLTTYYGGKSTRMGKIIAAKIEAIPHRIYCEPFGGMAGVLMQKRPSPVEIYNDLSEGLVTLFRVVRQHPEELRKALELTPYSRQEWKDCNQSYNYGEWARLADQVEKARIFYTLLAQSFTGTVTNGGWSFGGPKYASNVANSFYNSLENISAVAARLRSVQIECQDALKVMERWDTPETCFYLDPPYLWETRGQKSKGRKPYEHELGNEQHEALLDFCLKAKGKIIISGYKSNLYDEALLSAGWVCETFEAWATSAVYTLANGLKGKIPEVTKRTECLWINPPAYQVNRTLWEVQDA